MLLQRALNQNSRYQSRMKFHLVSTVSRLFSKVLRLRYSFFSGKILSVRAVCTDQESRIYLVRHSYTPGWHLPGGGVDNGASVEEALSNELREEGNLSLIGKPVLQHIYLNAKGSRREHIVLFTARVQQLEPFSGSLEIIEGRFFAVAELPDDLDPACRQRIQEWVVGEFGAAAW